MIENPFEIMNRYSESDLENMTVEELIVVQRSVLFEDEQKIFDSDKTISFRDGDSRNNFFDFTDKLICNKTINE